MLLVSSSKKKKKKKKKKNWNKIKLNKIKTDLSKQNKKSIILCNEIYY